LDIDDNLLLETLMQIEKQLLQTQSNNQFIQHENVMSNNTPSLHRNYKLCWKVIVQSRYLEAICVHILVILNL